MDYYCVPLVRDQCILFHKYFEDLGEHFLAHKLMDMVGGGYT